MSSFFGFIGSILQFAFYGLIILGIIALFGYNKLRALSENVKEAFSNIGVTARKQVSLTNQLIDTVKGYANNEKFIQLKVSSDMSVSALAQSHQDAGSIVAAINGMAQRFPALRANEQYNMLMQAISAVENDLEAQRERYNAAAKHYNVQRTSIPHVFYSSTLGFSPAAYLDFAEVERDDVGAFKSITSDDGERLNDLLGVAGSKTASVLRTVSSKAIEHGKGALTAAQARVKQLQLEEFTYLDAERNPQGPVRLGALKELHAQGLITGDTSVMPIGAKAWIKFADVLASEEQPPL